MIDDHPRTVTTDFVYCRFHGDHYRGRYGTDRIGPWAEWLRAQVGDGVDVWAFFNNDENGYAVEDAEELRRQLLDSH